LKLEEIPAGSDPLEQPWIQSHSLPMLAGIDYQVWDEMI